MKRIKLSLFILSLLFGTVVFAQQEVEWCGTDLMLQEYFEANPEAELQFQKSSMVSPEQLAKREKANGKLIIPIVVHVMHNEGKGNISKAQIEDGIRILNEDFSKMNNDTSSVRNIFKPLIADVEVEFRLAKIDPNGNCTEGITRNNSLTTESPSNRNAPKLVVQWNPLKYLNVWLVNSINSGSGGGQIGGFAQFPNPGGGPNNTFGLVVRNDEWGTIGTAVNSSFGGRAPTHEIGHCFWLYHPFQPQGSTTNGCGGDCTSTGDYVCDTPPQISSNNNSCSHNLNTCSNDANGGNPQNVNPFTTDVPDQIENFMGYGLRCQVMFTEGQKRRMHDALHQFDVLKFLHTESNLIATGINDNYAGAPCLPTLQVEEPHQFACIGDSITFSENSWGGVIDTYNWSFPGANPSTSSSATPTVAYDSAGVYNVTLSVSNSRGTDSIVLSKYVSIAQDTGYSATTYYESFENNSKFERDWTVLNYSLGSTWGISNFAALGGRQSVWIQNYDKQPGNVEALVSPAIDFSAHANPSIYFDVAYRKKDILSNDKLKVYLSDSCGAVWELLVSLPPSALTDNSTPLGGQFLPERASDWKRITLPAANIPAKFKNSTNTMVKIEIENAGGNNVYIDNFTLDNTLTGIETVDNNIFSNFRVYPNPAENNVTIQVEATKINEYTSIYLTDILGKRVANVFEGEMNQSDYTFNVDLNSFAPGVYFVTIQNVKERKTKKLIVR